MGDSVNNNFPVPFFFHLITHYNYGILENISTESRLIGCRGLLSGSAQNASSLGAEGLVMIHNAGRVSPERRGGGGVDE